MGYSNDRRRAEEAQFMLSEKSTMWQQTSEDLIKNYELEWQTACEAIEFYTQTRDALEVKIEAYYKAKELGNPPESNK